MPAVPLGVEAYSRAVSFQPETRLVNLYMEEDKSGASPDQMMRLQRPGLTRLTTFPATIRGIFQSDNPQTKLPVVVAGDQWFELDGTIHKFIGTVSNDGTDARVEATALVIACVSGGSIYLFDGTTATANPLPNGEQCVDVTTLNGYLIFATASGRFYWLVPGATAVQALDYATAEAHPDGLVAARTLRDDIFFFGTDSIEVWQATGDADATFKRADGRLIDRGLLNRDSLVEFDNTFVWVGDNGIVYRLADVPDRISTFGIEEKLKARTDDPSAWVFTTCGHTFYVLNIPGQGTFAYDAATKLWCEFSTIGSTCWRVTTGADLGTVTLAGDATGAIFRLSDDSSLDDGNPFQRLVTGTVPLPARPVANSSLALGVGSDVAADLALRWNDPQRGWSQPVTLSARGGSDIVNAWRLGMARAPCRTFEVSTISPAVIRISGAMANEAWQV